MDASPKDFANVDHSQDPSFYKSYLAKADSLPYIQEYKRKSFDLMAVKTGSKVIDVGCGLGFDAIALAKIVGNSGQIVAVDSSRSMIEAATAKAKDLGLVIEFILGDARNLSFEDECFDCAKVDRTLQHIPEPEIVLAEMARVIKSGGHLVAYEPDWDTFIIASNNREVTRKMIHHWCDSIKNGWIGRCLFEHFKKLKIEDIQVYPSSLVVNDLSLAEMSFDITNNAKRALNLGLVSKSEMYEWLRELRENDEKGSFFCSYTGFMVAGRKK